ncbi:hypothetical protein C8Q76DRAFT_697910 [Earliella scabrosa]|nr:hypothetical protein C8Q76DRAFT_697910 [Earliella scabrosa]
MAKIKARAPNPVVSMSSSHLTDSIGSSSMQNNWSMDTTGNGMMGGMVDPFGIGLNTNMDSYGSYGDTRTFGIPRSNDVNHGDPLIIIYVVVLLPFLCFALHRKVAKSLERLEAFLQIPYCMFGANTDDGDVIIKDFVISEVSIWLLVWCNKPCLDLIEPVLACQQQYTKKSFFMQPDTSQTDVTMILTRGNTIETQLTVHSHPLDAVLGAFGRFFDA